MKKISILIALMILLSACGSEDINKEQTKVYEGFKESLLNNGELISSNIPFDYSIKVEKKASKYLYTITISKPQLAMKSIQMLVLNPDDLTTDYISSTKGIFDETTYAMVPNQENIEEGYTKDITLSGVSKKDSFRIYAMVVWKDANGLNQSQAFFSFNVVDTQDVKTGES